MTVLYDEPRALVVPPNHRLAGKESITLDDIADEPTPRVRNSDPAWSAFWGIDPRPDLTTIPLESVEPSHIVQACRADDRNRLVAAFCKLAQTHITAPA